MAQNDIVLNFSAEPTWMLLRDCTEIIRREFRKMEEGLHVCSQLVLGGWQPKPFEGDCR